MKNSIIIPGFLLALVCILANCNTHSTEKQKQNIPKKVQFEKNEYKGTVFEEAFNVLKSGENLSKLEIDEFAKDVETRADFYRLLAEFNKEYFFPKEYYTFEKAAESVMVNWLEYPTELDTIPSKIELLKKVDYLEKDTTFTYYVFRFKTEKPHWAAKDGWMIGVVGPYFVNSKPYNWTTGTFSKFSKLKETTPEKEAEWAHQNIYRKSPE